MAAYIQKQIDVLQCMPVDLRRRLETIHEVEEQIVSLKRQVVQSLEVQNESKRTKISKSVQDQVGSQLQKMRTLQNRQIEIARRLQEQIARGGQQIQRDLRSLRAQFEEEKRLEIFNQKRLEIYNQKRNQSDNQSKQPSPLPLTLASSKPSNKRSQKSQNSAEDQLMQNDYQQDQVDYDKIFAPQLGGLYGQLTPTGLQFQALGITLDEPKYCICNRVSFGDMIMCDNEQCQIQWFHFECVGLSPESVPPEDLQWFCPQCRDGQDSTKQKPA